MYKYNATIVNVVDGDTVDAIVDLGFHLTAKIRLRLLGINVPEVKGETKEYGLQATYFLANLILNRNVVIETEKTDSFGRWLATIYCDQVSTKSINTIMIMEGHAVVYVD